MATTVIPGKGNVRQQPLVEKEKIVIPALHVKLGLMKNAVKALYQNGDGFKYLRERFPKIT